MTIFRRKWSLENDVFPVVSDSIWFCIIWRLMFFLQVVAIFSVSVLVSGLGYLMLYNFAIGTSMSWWLSIVLFFLLLAVLNLVIALGIITIAMLSFVLIFLLLVELYLVTTVGVILFIWHCVLVMSVMHLVVLFGVSFPYTLIGVSCGCTFFFLFISYIISISWIFWFSCTVALSCMLIMNYILLCKLIFWATRLSWIDVWRIILLKCKALFWVATPNLVIILFFFSFLVLAFGHYRMLLGILYSCLVGNFGS